jgi:hypothetical protein
MILAMDGFLSEPFAICLFFRELLQFMSTINEVFEIHLHGQVQLRQDVTDKDISDALKPLWSQTGENTFKKGSSSIYEDEPGIVVDSKEHMLRICWTVVGEMKFHQNLDEFCMGLNELTAIGAAFEVTFYNEQFESGDQEDFVPDEEEEGEFFEESMLLFVGPTPAAIMQVQRDLLVQDAIGLMERHFDGSELGEVVEAIDRLFERRFDDLVRSMQLGKPPRGSGGSSGGSGHGGGRKPRHLH